MTRADDCNLPPIRYELSDLECDRGGCDNHADICSVGSQFTSFGRDLYLCKKCYREIEIMQVAVEDGDSVDYVKYEFGFYLKDCVNELGFRFRRKELEPPVNDFIKLTEEISK